jgi:hypothetical protein
MVEISEDLKDIVSTTIQSIKQGIAEEKCGLSGTIKFEVAVAKSSEAKTGFKVFIADAAGKYSKDCLSKISFEIAGVLSESEKIAMNNQMAQLQRIAEIEVAKDVQLKKEIEKLNNTISGQELKLNQKENQIQNLTQEVNKLNRDIASANQQLDTANRSITDMSCTVSSLEKQLKADRRIIVK